MVISRRLGTGPVFAEQRTRRIAAKEGSYAR
jgi:hypothetical protein